MGQTFFLSEPIDTLSPDSDTLRLFEASLASGRATVWVTPQQTLSIDGHLFLNQEPVMPDDVVWIRLAPTPSWHEFLVFLAAHPVRFINEPAAMLLFPDKARCGALSVANRFVVSNRADALRAFDLAVSNGHRGLAVKAMTGYDARSITPAFDREAVEHAFLVHSADSGLAICEPWIGPDHSEEGEESAVRLTFAGGRFLGAVDYCGPAGSLSSPRLGASCRPASPLPDTLLSTIQQHAEMLCRHGVFLVGYDLIEGRVLEANTSCPGALSELERHTERTSVHAHCITEGLQWALDRPRRDAAFF